MLWMVRHLWPSIDSFVFNGYCHWSWLVLRNRYGTASLLRSREGVTQGDPIYMVAYSIVILMMIKQPKAAYPEVTHI